MLAVMSPLLENRRCGSTSRSPSEQRREKNHVHSTVAVNRHGDRPWEIFPSLAAYFPLPSQYVPWDYFLAPPHRQAAQGPTHSKPSSSPPPIPPRMRGPVWSTRSLQHERRRQASSRYHGCAQNRGVVPSKTCSLQSCPNHQLRAREREKLAGERAIFPWQSQTGNARICRHFSGLLAEKLNSDARASWSSSSVSWLSGLYCAVGGCTWGGRCRVVKLQFRRLAKNCGLADALGCRHWRAQQARRPDVPACREVTSI